MCLELRKTVRRGFSAVPVMLLRTCVRRRSCRRFFCFCWSMVTLVDSRKQILRSRERLSPREARPASGLTAACKGLAFLAADLFVFVADSLALIRFGLSCGANLGSELTDFLLVGALYDNSCRI